MSDRDRLLKHLEQHGSITSYDIRVNAISGNPSERVRELRDLGHTIDAERFLRGGRPCVRYTLRGHPVHTGAPDSRSRREPAPSAGGSTPSYPSPPSASVPHSSAAEPTASRGGGGKGAGHAKSAPLQLFESTPGHLDPDQRAA